MAGEFPYVELTLREYAETFRQNTQQILIDEGNDVTGELVNTIRMHVSVSGQRFVVSIDLQHYWYWVANGRPPGKFPPVESMLAFVRQKPVIPREDTLGRVPTENQLAFLIGRKIANEGTEGNNFLERASEETYNEFRDRLDEALRSDLENYTEEMLKVLGRGL